MNNEIIKNRSLFEWLIIERLRQFRSLIWYILPEKLKNIIYEYYSNKKTARELNIFLNNFVSETDVEDAFKKLNINGDVLVHSSLVDIGNIDKKHRTIVKCLSNKVIDNNRTILAIAIPVKGSSKDYLKRITSFDKNAPIAMGKLSKYYASLPDACRSLNPTHSVVAIGTSAKYYTSNHHLDSTPFDKNSPFRRLVEQDGNVLMVGAGLNHLTLIHLLEDIMGEDFPFKVYSKNKYNVDIYFDDGTIYHGQYYAHNKLMGALRVPQYINSKILALPSTQVVPLGAGNIINLRARDVLKCLLKELYAGNTIYGHCYVSRRCKNRVKQNLIWLENLGNEI